MNVESDGPPSPAFEGRRGLLNKALWWIGGALAVALALVIAWYAGTWRARAEKEKVDADLTIAQAQLNALEARRLLHQTILQLEARNFGSAQDKAERTRQFLAAGSRVAQDPTAYQAALAELEAFRVQVDPDVGRQVTVLLKIARTLDEQLPPPPAPHGIKVIEMHESEIETPEVSTPSTP